MVAFCARERVEVVLSCGVNAGVVRRLSGGFAAACVLLVSGWSHADDISYGYDASGRLVSVGVAGNTAYYDYDAAGNITAIRRQPNVAALHADDAPNSSTSQATAR